MAIKKFPQDYTDITAVASKVMAAKPDGTPGWAASPNLQVATNYGASTTNEITIPSVKVKYKSVNAASKTWLLSNDVAEYGDFAIQKSSAQPDSTFAPKIYISNSDKVGILKTNPTEVLDVNGNIKASGTVSGTVFNPTSLRSRKRDIANYNGDALSEINDLKLHTYHFREYDTVEESPATYEEVVDADGNFTKRLITQAVMKDIEKEEISQMLNVGVILDEVNNPLIANQERGVLNLNNIVFLLAKSVQQLTARLEALEVR